MSVSTQNQKHKQQALPADQSFDQGSPQSHFLVPISAELIDLIHQLDGLNQNQMEKLGELLWALSSEFNNKSDLDNLSEGNVDDKDGGSLSKEQVQRLQIILKIHQVLALVKIDWKQASKSLKVHLEAILEQLKQDGGLTYSPHERTRLGRTFEHANDTRALVNSVLQYHSSKTTGTGLTKKSQSQQISVEAIFYIKVEEDLTQNSQKEQSNGSGKLTQVSSVSTDLSNLSLETSADHSSSTDKQALFSLKKSLLQLTLQANGKANLYCEGYIWYSYIVGLYHEVHAKTPALSKEGEAEFDEQVVKKHSELQRLKGLSEFLKKVAANITKFPFDKTTYQKYVNDFGGRAQLKKLKLVEEVQRSLFVAQIQDNKDALYWIEKLLVQLLGYYEISVRDQAVILLNMLYDGVDWQLTNAFKPVIRCVGQHFKVNVVVDFNFTKEGANSQIFLGLSAPVPNLAPVGQQSDSHTALTWHKIEKHNIVSTKGPMTEINVNFGKFWKCGFYDWRFVAINETGRLQPLEIIALPSSAGQFLVGELTEEQKEMAEEAIGQVAQGRFIVHAKGMRDHIFHEVQVDYQDAEVESKTGKVTRRGDFLKVQQSIDGFKKKGITVLYLLGVLERDNYPYLDKSTNEIEFRKADAAPLAITCRQTANKMLGGDAGFKLVMNQAKKSKLKVIIDCLSRVSSSRNHRKYRDLLMYTLDAEGKRKVCYGTDGQSINYEDTALLNYRKLEAWDLLIEEVLKFAEQHGIDGIHLDNGQAWPQIMEPDLEELMRLDVDGQPAYTPEDIMNGEIVLHNERYGYWSTNAVESYPNPFFVKLNKRLWAARPEFIVVGECWGGYLMENRQIFMSRSGVIPRMFKLPQAISTLFGKKLHKDGRVTECIKENVTVLKKFHEENRQFLPEGSILLQSSSANNWPYPAFLYGKGTWAAVDILYFMGDVPFTQMGEIEGAVYKVGAATRVFQHEQQQQRTTGLKRQNSQIMMALNKQEEDDSLAGTQKIQTRDDTTIEKRRALPRVRSGSELSAVLIETKQGADIKQKEHNFIKEIGPDAGFDLSKIGSHYESRNRLRRDKMALRYGELVPLVARYNKTWRTDVLAFARYSIMETAIVATNLSDQPVSFWIDMSALANLYLNIHSSNTVVMVNNWIDTDYPAEYFFLREFLLMKKIMSLQPFHSLVFGIQICQSDDFVLNKVLQQSLNRTMRHLTNKQTIESDQLSLLFTDILEQAPQDITRFANVIGSIQTNFLNKQTPPMLFNELFRMNHKLRNDSVLASRLMALCLRISEVAETSEIAPVVAAKSVVFGNTLGPIIFCTPELGRWSTVGGLGVMVDELAIGLADLGQDVWVISPYYERNRKGETGYLAKDPAGINYVENISVELGGQVTVLGVHMGVVDGVKVVFLHHSEIFPAPYADALPHVVMQQLAVFGKGCLEFCCKRQIFPAVCVTNDWYTGLIPAYAKIGAFGDIFKGTTFLHIAHNLEETYEGRLYPQPNQGGFENIHFLPREYLVNPYWPGKVIVNPSRCAVMLSDQWATVSPSYKLELLKDSSLRDLLMQKSHPFAFPNGIPVEARLKKLDQAAPDHYSAKRLIQMKYFGYADIDDTIPLFAFVGRITTQKGVHLIMDGAEHLIHKSGFKINIIVGGMANMKDPYGAAQAHKMWYLKNKYPNCFWADPQAFFTDGSLINRGADFGLMPSVFEPGGIVQHEFFVAGTPVIAFKTGGLKDSVFEYQVDKEEGCGFTFESHNVNDYIFACERALAVYTNKPKYKQLRSNAFKATMDGDRVSRAWLREFFRLKDKIFIDEVVLRNTLNILQPWAPSIYKPMESFEQMFGIDLNQQDAIGLPSHIEDIDLGATEAERELKQDDTNKKPIVRSHFELSTISSGFGGAEGASSGADEKFPHVFMMHNKGQRHEKVELCGSFDNWKLKHPMNFDQQVGQWFITIHLPKGKYWYKYVINGSQWVVNEKEPNEKDAQGNVNNVLTL